MQFSEQPPLNSCSMCVVTPSIRHGHCLRIRNILSFWVLISTSKISISGSQLLLQTIERSPTRGIITAAYFANWHIAYSRAMTCVPLNTPFIFINVFAAKVALLLSRSPYIFACYTLFQGNGACVGIICSSDALQPCSVLGRDTSIDTSIELCKCFCCTILTLSELTAKPVAEVPNCQDINKVFFLLRDCLLQLDTSVQAIKVSDTHPPESYQAKEPSRSCRPRLLKIENVLSLLVILIDQW